MNIVILLEKVQELYPDEEIEIEKLNISEGITVRFHDRRSRMALRKGDSWNKVCNFLKESKERLDMIEFTCPMCIESKSKGGTVLTCNQCF